MNPSQIFQIVNPIATLGWILLIIFPNWKFTKRITSLFLPAILFAVLYIAFLGSSFGKTAGNFQSLEGVRLLFSNDFALLAGWIHYLAFDLFIGTWEVEDAKSHHIPRYFIVPCLFLTFMFGPAGLFCYTMLKITLRKPLFA